MRNPKGKPLSRGGIQKTRRRMATSEKGQKIDPCPLSACASLDIYRSKVVHCSQALNGKKTWNAQAVLEESPTKDRRGNRRFATRLQGITRTPGPFWPNLQIKSSRDNSLPAWRENLTFTGLPSARQSDGSYRTRPRGANAISLARDRVRNQIKGADTLVHRKSCCQCNSSPAVS